MRMNFFVAFLACFSLPMMSSAMEEILSVTGPGREAPVIEDSDKGPSRYDVNFRMNSTLRNKFHFKRLYVSICRIRRSGRLQIQSEFHTTSCREILTSDYINFTS